MAQPIHTAANVRFHRHGLAGGFSLIEVLIAMMLLAVGSCGLTLLLITSVSGTAEAQDQSNAALHASELAQLIHANPASLGHFMFPEQTAKENWEAAYLEHWQSELESQLGEAVGIVCRDITPLDGTPADPGCDGQGPPVVKIVWQKHPQPPGYSYLSLPLSEP